MSATHEHVMRIPPVRGAVSKGGFTWQSMHVTINHCGKAVFSTADSLETSSPCIVSHMSRYVVADL